MDQIDILHEEQKIVDEMSVKGKVTNSKEADGFVFACEFDSFSVRIPRKEFQGPSSGYEIVNANGKSRDLLADVPEGWAVDVTQYPFGNVDPEAKVVSAPRPVTKGRLVSGMHEIEHAIKRAAMSEEEQAKLNEARVAFKNHVATPEQSNLVLEEEKGAWAGVGEKIKDIEKDLDITIISDWNAFEALVARRMSDYEHDIPRIGGD